MHKFVFGHPLAPYCILWHISIVKFLALWGFGHNPSLYDVQKPVRHFSHFCEKVYPRI